MPNDLPTTQEPVSMLQSLTAQAENFRSLKKRKTLELDQLQSRHADEAETACKRMLDLYQEFASSLARQERAVQQQQSSLETEIARMEAPGATEGDILELNVGGKPMSTTRDTLTQVPGSMLAIQFGLHWVERQKRDNQGRIFLNYDPYCFERILSFLRCKLVEHPDHPTLPPVVKHESQAEFASLTQFLGLENFISSAATANPATDFSFHEAIAMHLTSNRHVATTFGNIGYAIVSPRLKIGRHFLKICIDSSSPGYQWLFLGVTSLSHPKQNMEFDATSFGWAAGTEYIAGKGEKQRWCLDWDVGDEVVFVIDVTEQYGRLTMAYPQHNYKLERMFCATRSTRQGNAWSFALGASCDMCIRMSSVSSQDWNLLNELPTVCSASSKER